MRRREFFGVFANVAIAAPLPMRAQPPAIPVIGYLSSVSVDSPSVPVEAIHLALRQAGYEVGQTVRIEYRFANNQLDRLLALAAELVRIPAAVIITSGGPGPALAAKAATTTIPIVFAPMPGPVRNGLVASLNRPGGNITGVAALTIELDPKRLELLHELAPSGSPIGVLFNPTRLDSHTQLEGITGSAQSIGRQLILAPASTVELIDEAFATFARRSIGALLVVADPFFNSYRRVVIALAARYGWPAMYQWREFAADGGLVSYGLSLFDSYYQVGLFAAHILEGKKPTDLPVQQPTKFELVINLRTAKTLGITIPPTLLARADEVIE
jgi:ABC-type uncharacterized transport system substrate-binding protein